MKNLYYWLFFIGTLIWLSAIMSYPFLLKIKSPVAPYVHLAFSFVCHQKEERCFRIKGTPLPVCSRCTGIYVSFFASFLFLPSLKKSIPLKWYYLPLSASPMGIEIMIEKAGIWNGNWMRFFSSIFFGFFLSYIVISSLRED